MIYVTIFFIFILFMESMFCLVMKKYNCKKDMNAKVLSKVKKNQEKPKLLQGCFNFADDFTFMLFKIVGYIPSHFVRKIFYKYIFHMTMGKRIVIHYGLEARSPWNILIGEGTVIGDHVILDARGRIKIGKNVNMSTGVNIWTVQHNVHSPVFGIEGKKGEVTVGDCAWLSTRVIILPNISVNDGAVVAAGAVLTKNCVPYGIYGGIPAKFISKRNISHGYNLSGRHRLFL